MGAQAMHEAMPETTTTEGERLSSRHGFLSGSATLAGAGALVLGAAAALPASLRSALAQEEVDVSTPVGVLNYALTLEHLEAAFYRDGLETFTTEDFVDAGFAEGVFANLESIRDHEMEHVETLTGAITDLDGEPVEEGEYDFGYEDVAGFVAVAQALENTGVAAYTGAAQYLIDDDELLTTALTIHGVEARHAAYLNLLNAASPFPDAVDAPLTPDEVLAVATPFVVSASGDEEDASEEEDEEATPNATDQDDAEEETDDEETAVVAPAAG